MTYTEAMEVRLRHAQRQPVDPEELELANRVVKAVRQMQGDMPEPEPVKAAVPQKPAFPVKHIPVGDDGDDEQVELLWASLKPVRPAVTQLPKPVRELSDRPRAGRVGPWKPVEVLVLVHDRNSVSLGQLHKVNVQVVDFYP